MAGKSIPNEYDSIVAQNERLTAALEAAGIGTWDYDLLTGQAQWSAICKQLFGLPPYAQVTAKELLEQVHPDDRARVDQANKAALSPTGTGQHQIIYRTLNQEGNLRWVEAKGKTVRNVQGQIVRFSGIVQDVTQQVQSREQAEASETKLRGIIAAAPAGIGLFVGRELIIENPNQTFIDIVGKGPGVEGLPLRAAMPELLSEGQPFLKILDDVFTTGIPFISPASLVKIVQNEVLNDNYYNISYTPVYNAAGEVYAILDIAIDVTAQVTAQQQVKASEARFRSIVEQAPLAIGLLRGRELVIEVGNPRIFEVWGKEASITGMRLIEALPELKGQVFIDLLEGVYNSGAPFFGNGVLAKLMRGGKLEEVYFDFVYTPLRDPDETITGVMVLATEVTQQVLARQKIEEAETTLRGAVELAELGTWKMDVATGQMTYSDRLQGWLGVNDAVMGREASPRVHPKDRERVSQAMVQALEKGSSGRYDETYTITHALTGQQRIIRASGQTSFDADGNALSLAGTAQDVTLQQELQLALTHQVQQRTQELQTANADLTRSNENLQQFAYIASHDLQEPLRKIQAFGDLLKIKFTDPASEEVDYLGRMQGAASRMSILIKDLLTFSRISTQRDTNVLVSLTDIVQAALLDLDMIIQETGARVTIDPLPMVEGDQAQLRQLFQNLLSNALKFRHKDQPPVIEVTYKWLAADSLPAGVLPDRTALAYHLIQVIDNGIGFNEKYKDRIFQVFQRLHGKSDYAGTGIGLAICEKVVTNHGGAITATSQPGRGATFSVYLPV